jgi:hypothetical protein
MSGGIGRDRCRCVGRAWLGAGSGRPGVVRASGPAGLRARVLGFVGGGPEDRGRLDLRFSCPAGERACKYQSDSFQRGVAGRATGVRRGWEPGAGTARGDRLGSPAEDDGAAPFALFPLSGGVQSGGQRAGLFTGHVVWRLLWRWGRESRARKRGAAGGDSSKKSATAWLHERKVAGRRGAGCGAGQGAERLLRRSGGARQSASRRRVDPEWAAARWPAGSGVGGAGDRPPRARS